MDEKLQLRLVYSSKKRRPRYKRPQGLDAERARIRSLVRAGADFNFYKSAARDRDELRLRDTDIRNIVGSGRLESRMPSGALDLPQFVFVGSVPEVREDRRILREFAVTVQVEKAQRPGLLGVLRIRQLRERGS